MRSDLDAGQAKRWRSKAEECRAVGDQMQDPQAKLSFWRMAQTYDSLASALEERAAPAVQKPEAG